MNWISASVLVISLRTRKEKCINKRRFLYIVFFSCYTIKLLWNANSECKIPAMLLEEDRFFFISQFSAQIGFWQLHSLKGLGFLEDSVEFVCILVYF